MISLESSELYTLSHLVGTRTSHELESKDLAIAKALRGKGLVEKVREAYIISNEGSQLLNHVVGDGKEFTKIGQLKIVALAHHNSEEGISEEEIKRLKLEKYLPYCLKHEILREDKSGHYKITPLGEGSIIRACDKAREYHKPLKIANGNSDVGHDISLITRVGLGDFSGISEHKYDSDKEIRIIDGSGNLVDSGSRERLRDKWTFSRMGIE